MSGAVAPSRPRPGLCSVANANGRSRETVAPLAGSRALHLSVPTPTTTHSCIRVESRQRTKAVLTVASVSVSVLVRSSQPFCSDTNADRQSHQRRASEVDRGSADSAVRVGIGIDEAHFRSVLHRCHQRQLHQSRELAADEGSADGGLRFGVEIGPPHRSVTCAPTPPSTHSRTRVDSRQRTEAVLVMACVLSVDVSVFKRRALSLCGP